MTDQEFEIMDELYFVRSFDSLFKQFNFSEEVLKHYLAELIKKDWVKCMKDLDEEVTDNLDFESKYKEYSYLVTKKGLMAHNGRF